MLGHLKLVRNEKFKANGKKMINYWSVLFAKVNYQGTASAHVCK